MHARRQPFPITMKTDLDLARLKALAENATPGPYVHDEVPLGAVELSDGSPLAQCFSLKSGDGNARAADNKQRNANAAYIAALDPATVIELIRRAERAGADQGRRRAVRTDPHCA